MTKTEGFTLLEVLVAGALLIPVGLLLAMACLMIVVVPQDPGPVAVQVGGSGATAVEDPPLGAVPLSSLFQLLPILLILIIPVTSTVLGGIGISQILRSEGKLYGMTLAVCVVLFHPCLVLLIVVVGLVRST